MDRKELKSHDPLFSKHVSTFRGLSYSKAQDFYCLPCSSEACSPAVNFDSVKTDWYSDRRKKGLGVPCSADAVCFVSNGNVFAVEFRNGKVKPFEIYRKAYDTVLALIEKDGQTPSCCREKLHYVLVYNRERVQLGNEDKRDLRFAEKGIFDHCYGSAEWQLKYLENFAVSRAYAIPSYLFSSFARKFNLNDADFACPLSAS